MNLRSWGREAAYRTLRACSGPGKGVRVILLYHSIGSHAPHSVSAESFKQQMTWLADHFKVVRLCDLPDAVKEQDPKTNLACITFDDGYRDNDEIALPVLESLNLQATFFIITGCLGEPFTNSYGSYPLMTSNQIQELATQGHEIGAHTIHHHDLTKLSSADSRIEIIESKQFLESLLQQSVTSLAYPKGQYSPNIKSYAMGSGFKIAVTVRPGLIRSSPDWLALPRIWINPTINMKSFVARLSPAVQLYARLKP